MLDQIQNYLTVGNIYLWSNFGIIPFWLLLIISPNSKICGIFINSIIIPLILSSLYIYVGYQMVINEENLLDIFSLYLSIDNLYTLFSSESFLIFFWLHFLSINLFLGSWISKDGLKHNVSRSITILALILTYFCGPIGLVFYWLFRIFFAKKISLHD